MGEAGKVRIILRISAIVLVCCLDLSIGFPTEQPTKFSLNTDDAGTTTTSPSQATSRLDQGRTLASESQNQFTTILSAKSDASNNSRRSLELTTNPPIIETAQNSRDTVKLYTEGGQGLLERPITKPFMEMLEAFFKPTPLVDNIKEREKYGNNGDKFIGIGRALVSSLEGFSNFLNSVIEVPRNTARKASRGLTEALNHVGARIIGLE
ncbi:uncharacterized protein LOC143207161 isoform X2 [Lasioglossum baleicum]|uniref:uncharacterized protein LOC143207161 isoform X2 n=1 Tax=Lasioglossum baleicum TaxID=434251 RepID=UPI003FCCDA5E